MPIRSVWIGTNIKTKIDMNTIVTCKFCGTDFEAWLCQKRKYCSLVCRNKSYQGKPSWNKGLKKGDRPSMKQMGFQESENNPMWCGGDSDKERRNSQYKNWRIKVFERDDFTCQKCNYINGRGIKRRDLNAHHIVRWIDSLELRYKVDNGITLCVPCHIKEHQGSR